MRTTSILTLCLVQTVFAATNGGCNRDVCAEILQSEKYGSAARAGCRALTAGTVTASTFAMPTYGAGCLEPTAFASACSCWGQPKQLNTAKPDQISTKTGSKEPEKPKNTMSNSKIPETWRTEVKRTDVRTGTKQPEVKPTGTRAPEPRHSESKTGTKQPEVKPTGTRVPEVQRPETKTGTKQPEGKPTGTRAPELPHSHSEMKTGTKQPEGKPTGTRAPELPHSEMKTGTKAPEPLRTQTNRPGRMATGTRSSI